jgi:hypothetical protein
MFDKTLQALAAPFEPFAIHWKAQAVSGNRALAVAYLDARAVMDRLDDVVGLGWADKYEVLADGSVLCRLEIVVDGRTVQRCDVGSPSEQPDAGDQRKAAVSDALKRAAIKFGIGRYLYRLPKQWVGYCPQKKQLTEVPKLPAWAMPQAPAVITHEQAKELQRLLQASANVDAAKFLARFAAKRLSEIPGAQYGAALAVLKAPSQDLLRKPAA